MSTKRLRARKAEPQLRAADTQEPESVDRRLAALAARALAGEPAECAWELFRLEYFPGWKPARIAAALGAWSRRQGLTVSFEIRKQHNVDIIYMLFARCSG